MGSIARTATGPAAARRPSQLMVARHLLGLCRPHAGKVLVIFGLQTSQLVTSLIALRFLGAGIDFLKAWMRGTPAETDWPLGLGPPAAWPPWAAPVFAAGMMLAISGLRVLMSARATISLSVLMHSDIIPTLQRQVFARLQQLSFRFFDRQHSGAIINRVTGDVQAVRLFVESVLLESLTLGLTSIIYAAYMFNVQPLLTLACMAPMPLMVFAAVRFSRTVRPLHLESRARFDRMVLNLSESAQGAYMVKSLSLEQDSCRRFAGFNDAVQECQRRIFRRVSFFAPVLNMLNHLSLVILVLYGGWLVIRGDLALGTGFVVFASLLQQLSNQVASLSQIVTTVQESLSGAERVFEILHAEPDLKSPRQPKAAGRVCGAVEFDAVSFGYSADRPALSGIRFKVKPGQVVAILGETGAGKSAMLSLIPRFYDVDTGRVLVDGTDVREWDLKALRSQVGIVFQEPFIFSATIADNIRLGSERATREDIVRAARLAHAAEFIDAYEEGYDTLLDESGNNLSGGQRQRIALARALVADPAILLLDDPTSALDPETEHEIFQAMEDAMRSRTTFIIAHRLSTLRRADLILVLKEGRLIDMGTHDELLATSPLYRRAAAVQLHAHATVDQAEALLPALQERSKL